MPRITEEIEFGGAKTRAARLGLESLLDEVRSVLTGFQLLVKEERDTNGGAVMRKLLDERFEQTGGWQTDRGPKIADAKRLAPEAHVQDLPLIFIAFEHDGPGPALPKQRKRTSTEEESG